MAQPRAIPGAIRSIRGLPMGSGSHAARAAPPLLVIPRPRLRARRPVALLAVAFAFCGFTEEAVLCEEAAAHLSECCPSFEPTFLRCETPSFPTGCAEVDAKTEESRCIVKRSCAELRADGTCDRACAAWTQGQPAAGTPVCR